MADEKNFLQTIKLDISRNFKLTPYERIAFHKLLGINKSAAGRELLVRELDKEGDVRQSAMMTLAEFDVPDLVPVFRDFIQKDISEDELLIILDFLSRHGTEEEIPVLIDLAENLKDKSGNEHTVRKIFNVLQTIGSSNTALYDYLLSIAEKGSETSPVTGGAVNALSVFRKVEVFENLLKKKDDDLSFHVFHALYCLNLDIEDAVVTEEKEYSPTDRLIENELKQEDEILLQVKVLLGKISSRFDDFSARTKNAYINAMLSCSHRESVIYCMKALESGEPDLISMVLYSIYNNITRLRLPEKLFRSLIAMNVENDRDSELIGAIFIRYFREISDSRSHSLFREKQYGHISATLESFFETYRREFMIPDVVENSFPENIQKVRKFILGKFNPEQKRKLLMFLENRDKPKTDKFIDELSKSIIFVEDECSEAMSLLVDMLMDEDIVSRQNSASQLESINFERRYLQSKIIRLCRIIGALQIDSAASSLVYIYNYLKKYPEPEILQASMVSLCRINYSYMLSELEIMLTAGSEEDQIKAVSLLPLFRDKRLINILVDYLNMNAALGSTVVQGIAEILSSLDIRMNINAAGVFKKLIENNPDIQSVRYALSGLGRCAFSDDIAYLNDFFHKTEENELKEAAVKGLGFIVSSNTDYNTQQLTRFIQEYLKDPGIKIRIFSCMILLELGNMDVLKNIRDMLVIKNKSIQREILSILRGVRSPEFYFFLISLLKEEYGISNDIASVLEKLPQEELLEIENFIINLFRKFEVPSIGTVRQKTDESSFGDLERKMVTVLFISVMNYGELESGRNFLELIRLNLKLDDIFLPSLNQTEGTVSHKDSSRIAVWYEEPGNAIAASEMIRENLKRFNDSTVPEKNIIVHMSVVTDYYYLKKDELFGYLEEPRNVKEGIPLENRVIIDHQTEEAVKEEYYARPVPEILYSRGLSRRNHFELISPVNFRIHAFNILRARQEELEQKKEMEAKIEEQVKALKSGNRSTTSIAIASELEDIGIKLRLQFEEIERYLNRRSTDKELNRNVKQMLNNAYNLYRVEISKLTIK